MTAGPVVAQQESAAFAYGAAGPSGPTTPSGNAQVTTMASGTGTSPPEGTSQVDDIDEALLSPRTKPIDEPDAMDISTSAPLAASASVTAAAEPRNIAELQSAQVTSFNTTEQAAAPMDIWALLRPHLHLLLRQRRLLLEKRNSRMQMETTR